MSNLKRYTLYILNIIDIVSFLLSYYPAYFIALSPFFRGANIYGTFELAWYAEFLITVLVSYVIINVLSLYQDDKYLKRTASQEFIACVKLIIYVIAMAIILFYVQKKSEYYSRLFTGLYCISFTLTDFLLRMYVKKHVLPKIQNSNLAEKIVVIADSANIAGIIDQLTHSNDWRYRLIGAVITDRDPEHVQTIHDVPVIRGSAEEIRDFIEFESSSVLYAPSGASKDEMNEYLQRFQAMGKTIHLKLDEGDLPGFKKLDVLGGTTVMTFSPAAPVAKRKMILIRMLDVAACLISLPFFLLVVLLAGAANALFSPGPLFTRHVRIGQNGGRYYLYRFRIHYIEPAENSDTSRHRMTPAGKILSKTHLDGFAQWINVLSREMAIVGPKPAVLSEYIHMNAEERAQYLAKPGVVGLWSAGNGKEKNENEPSGIILSDLWIILRAILRYLSGKSRRAEWYDIYLTESAAQCRELYEETIPLAYEKTGFKNRPGFLFYVFKRAADIVLSILAIILLSPLFLVIAALIINDDGRTPFYSHSRIGQNGKRIHIFKFRSMREDAGDLERLLTPEQLEEYKKEFKISHDPRITRIGAFLRSTSLDELPQLFNVLGGSLSLIGPRPIVEEETEYYSGIELEKFLSVKPGLTGYWQAYARNNVGYNDGRRQKMELYYVDHQSVLLDIRIFFRTFLSVLKREGAM